MKRTSALLAGSALAVGLIASPAMAAHEGSVYEADLTEVADNDPGSPSGTATLTVSEDGETMSIDIEATGLAPFVHAQHIHAIVEGDEFQASACPTAELAGDDDVVTVAEGAPAYGGIQVSLTNDGDTSPDSGLAVERFDAGSSLSYSRSGIPIPENMKANLGKVHFVIHGVDENEDGELTMDQEERSSLTDDLPREATLPALCGTTTAVASGAVQTGAGGTATDTTGLGVLAATGLAALAGAGIVRRRRNDA